MDSLGRCTAQGLLDGASEVLTESLLVSAFDLYHQHIVLPEKQLTDIIIIDSGGYESSGLEDLSATQATGPVPGDWSAELHAATLRRLPSELPAVLVSFDRAVTRLPLAEQLQAARELFAEHPGQLHAFLLKPERVEDATIDLTRLLPMVEQLASFHIIGITEKEAGDTLLERARTIGRLRSMLDRAGIQAPIHVFGSLDPLSVPIYVLAGAEIFDGLTWLRYGYLDGHAVYWQNAAADLFGPELRTDEARIALMRHNLRVLVTLTYQLRSFATRSDLSVFGPKTELLQRVGDALTDIDTRRS